MGLWEGRTSLRAQVCTSNVGGGSTEGVWPREVRSGLCAKEPPLWLSHCSALQLEGAGDAAPQTSGQANKRTSRQVDKWTSH